MKVSLSENEDSLHQTNQATADAPMQYAERVAMLKVEIKELDEAIAAGRNVVAGLEPIPVNEF